MMTWITTKLRALGNWLIALFDRGTTPPAPPVPAKPQDGPGPWTPGK